MKNKKTIPLAIALISILLVIRGCTPYVEDSIILGGCEVTAKVDGESFCGDGYFSQDVGNGVLSINASDNDGGQVINLFTGEGTIGTFQLNYDMQSGASYTDGTATYYSTSGTLTITNYSEKKVSGMFSFDAQPLSGGGIKKITSGKFSVERVGTN